MPTSDGVISGRFRLPAGPRRSNSLDFNGLSMLPAAGKNAMRHIVGRQAEIDSVRQLLVQNQVVTLTGAGGVRAPSLASMARSIGYRALA